MNPSADVAGLANQNLPLVLGMENRIILGVVNQMSTVPAPNIDSTAASLKCGRTTTATGALACPCNPNHSSCKFGEFEFEFE